MSKYTILISMILLLVFSTILAGSLTNLSVDSTLITEGAHNFTFDVGSITSVFNYFFGIMTFQVEGIPSFINLLVFYPLTIGVLYILLETAIPLMSAIIQAIAEAIPF